MGGSEALKIAVQEFLHVGGALVIIIAVVSVFTGLLREYIPQDRLQATIGGRRRFGSLLGAAFGILTPFCSASVVPVSIGMAEAGVSLGTIFSFLISAPLCNFVVVGMVFAVFGWKVTVAYYALTFTSAVLSGFVIGRSSWRNEVKRGADLKQAKPARPTCCGASQPKPEKSVCGAVPAVVTVNSCCSSIKPPTTCTSSGAVTLAAVQRQKVQHALQFAWALFKRIIPYVLIGAAISGLSAAYLPAKLVEKYIGGGSWYAIPVAAGIGVPLYLRIEMAIPLLKVLIAKGMGMGAAMALLIGGTGASLPEIALISAVLKPKAVVAFVVAVFTTAVVGGVLYQFVL